MIEVLVALAIIAVALAASLRAVGVARDAAKRICIGGCSRAGAPTTNSRNCGCRIRGREIGSRSFDCSQGNLKLVCTQRVSATPNPIFRRVEMFVATPGRSGNLAQMVTVVANETNRSL